MQTNETKKAGASSFLGRMVRKQVMIPLAALLLLFLFNLIVDPSFFKIELGYNSAGNPVLSGFLITILDSGSELAILAIGMTLVTAATGGQDISVGATTAIAGSVLLRVLCGTNSRPETLQAPIIVAFLAACVVAMLFGAFNGVLVAVFKIQPMIATLILYTAGRSIAAWINNNELPVVSDETLTVQDGCQGAYSANLASDCGDFIIRRSDGLCAYHLAVVVDDALSGVTQVVRGRDILPSTPQQIYLQRLLRFPTPEYAHIPLLEDPEGRRLAKRDGDLGLSSLSRRFSRDAILGMLAFAASARARAVGCRRTGMPRMRAGAQDIFSTSADRLIRPGATSAV